MISLVTNTESLVAQTNLDRTSKTLAQNFGRLSSGLRINNAGDDAAGLAVSQLLKAQIGSIGQATRNSNDAVSLLQTADGAMASVGDILQRMRALATEAATGTLGTTDRGFLNNEFSQMKTEINRITHVTQFNGINLLDGTATSSELSFQVGIGATTNDRISIGITTLFTSALGTNNNTTSSLAAQNLSTITGAQKALGIIDNSISSISEARSSIGAVENRLQVTISNLQSANENLTAANSSIADVDVAAESANMTRNNILMQAGVSVLSQANQAPSLALSLLK